MHASFSTRLISLVAALAAGSLLALHAERAQAGPGAAAGVPETGLTIHVAIDGHGTFR